MNESALIDRMRPGDHISWIVEDDDARDRIQVAYVASAVAARHKVLCFTHTDSPQDAAGALVEAGVDTDALLGSGQLQINGADESYLSTGRFDVETTIETCARVCAEARAEGYAGIRLIGDMAWATGPVEGADRLEKYEAQVNRVYADGFAIGLCLYDRRLFDRARLADVQAAHPGSVDACVIDLTDDTDPFALNLDDSWSPLLRIAHLVDEPGLRLEGETDVSNRGSLIAVLEELIATEVPRTAPLVLDVTDLRFVDVATAHHLVGAAARAGTMRIVGASGQLTRLLAFAGGVHVPGLVVEPRSCLEVARAGAVPVGELV
jgi:anti-anti-sigma regulatory factor